MDLAFAQSNYSDFLQETWKIENKNLYEHRDRLYENRLKGCSYELSHGQIIVFEYMDIFRNNNEILLTVAIVNPNQGQDGNFKFTSTESTFTFEIPNQDFLKKIVYQTLNATKISVKVSGGNQRIFCYKKEK